MVGATPSNVDAQTQRERPHKFSQGDLSSESSGSYLLVLVHQGELGVTVLEPEPFEAGVLDEHDAEDFGDADPALTGRLGDLGLGDTPVLAVGVGRCLHGRILQLDLLSAQGK